MIRLNILAVALTLFVCSVQAQQQFVIGTDTPSAKSILELVSTDKGVLIPRMTTANRNAIAPAAADRGMLIYNTSTNEFNYWDGTQWVAFPSVADDPDWFVESTTNAPTAITDDIYHTGNVGVGQVTADYPLDIYTSSSSRGVDVNITGSTAAPKGISVTENTSGTGIHTGIESTNSGSHNQLIYGMNSTVSNSGSGTHIGFRTDLNTGVGSMYGVQNNLSGTGSNTGVSNSLIGTSTGSQYGVFNSIVSVTSAYRHGQCAWCTKQLKWKRGQLWCNQHIHGLRLAASIWGFQFYDTCNNLWYFWGIQQHFVIRFRS